MALAVAVRAKILVDLVDFGIQDMLDYVSLNLFVSGLKPHIQEERPLFKPERHTFDATPKTEQWKPDTFHDRPDFVNVFNLKNQS